MELSVVFDRLQLPLPEDSKWRRKLLAVVTLLLLNVVHRYAGIVLHFAKSDVRRNRAVHVRGILISFGFMRQQWNHSGLSDVNRAEERLMSRLSLLAVTVLFANLVSDNALFAQGPEHEQLVKQEEEFERRFPFRSEAERFFLLYHLSPEYLFNDNRRMLAITWFSRDVDVAYRYQVSETGKVFSELEIHNWSVRAQQIRELNSDQLKALQESISHLPASTTRPPISRTVYVSFHENNDWKTEVYDSSELSEEFKSVFEHTGARAPLQNR